MSRRQLEDANSFYVTTLPTLTNARATAAFTAVWQAIETLASTDAEITVANVAKVCATLPGGPREQSIRNDKARMKMLVQLANPKKSLGRVGASQEQTRVMCKDLNLKINALELENRLLRADNNRMRQAFKTYHFIKSEGDIFEVTSPRETVFTLEEKSAVSRFINDLSSEGLSFDPSSGEIVRENGRTFAISGFFSAVTKILTDKKDKIISTEARRA